MGGLRNTYLAFKMVAVANVGGGWATSGRTGLWVSETLVIDLEVVCWKLRRRQVFRLQIAAEFFRLVGAEILSEVVTPRMSVNASQSRQ